MRPAARSPSSAESTAASARVGARGFSHSTGLPAARQARTKAAWVESCEAMTTASTPSAASRASGSGRWCPARPTDPPWPRPGAKVQVGDHRHRGAGHEAVQGGLRGRRPCCRRRRSRPVRPPHAPSRSDHRQARSGPLLSLTKVAARERPAEAGPGRTGPVTIVERRAARGPGSLSVAETGWEHHVVTLEAQTIAYPGDRRPRHRATGWRRSRPARHRALRRDRRPGPAQAAARPGPPRRCPRSAPDIQVIGTSLEDMSEEQFRAFAKQAVNEVRPTTR